MQIHLSPRHVRLTAAIHQHAASRVLQLEDLTEYIVASHVVLIHDKNAKPSDRYSVKVHPAIPVPNIHAEEPHADLNDQFSLLMSSLPCRMRNRTTRPP